MFRRFHAPVWSFAKLRASQVAYRSPLARAASAHATGAVRLAEGDIAAASRLFSQASEIWRDLEMPYEDAQTRLLMATICERRNDLEGRRLEVEAAERLFKQLFSKNQ